MNDPKNLQKSWAIKAEEEADKLTEKEEEQVVRGKDKRSTSKGGPGWLQRAS